MTNTRKQASHVRKDGPGGWRGLATAITFATFAITFAALANRKPADPEIVYVAVDPPTAPETVSVDQPVWSTPTGTGIPKTTVESGRRTVPLAAALIVSGPQVNQSYSFPEVSSGTIAPASSVPGVTLDAAAAVSPAATEIAAAPPTAAVSPTATAIAVVPPTVAIIQPTATPVPAPTQVIATPAPQRRVVVIPFPKARSRAS